MKDLHYAKAYVREVKEEDGKLVGVIGSTSTPDRYNESIDQSTWDLKHYKKNPIILWAHNLTFGEDRPPIGKAIKVKVEDDKLMFDIQFDMADPFAADIFRKYKEGFLNAFSVGFIPHKIQRSDDGNTPPVLMDNELLELSAVPVPANPEALNTLRARSFKTKDWDTLMKEVEKEEAEEEKIEHVAKEVKSLSEEELNEVSTKVAEKILPDLTKAITDVVIKANPEESPKENKGGQTEPKKPQVGGKANLAAIMREATKLLQGGLAEHNANNRK